MTAAPSPWLQRWYATLVAATSVALLQLHLWPKQPQAPIPSQARLPGTSLPPLPAGTTSLGSLSPTLRRQLGSGMELRLTTLASRHAANLQVAALTASTPSLKLHQRRLLDDGLAIGRLQDRPAVQTCLIGSDHGVTAAALHGLKPHQAASASLLLQRWLGLDRHAVNTCLLVTVVQDQPPGSRPSSQAMVQTMQALLRAI